MKIYMIFAVAEDTATIAVAGRVDIDKRGTLQVRMNTIPVATVRMNTIPLTVVRETSTTLAMHKMAIEKDVTME